jgi:DNA (cytosine-5)-methyltransferase 1
MTAVYNELDAYAAQWLGNLSAAGHIASGAVDTRSIREVKPDDVRHATQFHAFAGIGAWSHALRLAGWPDDRPVWTGSCPCQPFSVAGRRKGTDDERHLWPEWHRLIAECLPPVVFGEQVASADGRAWLDAVRADLEALGYAVGAADCCAAGVGAPHIRQRLYFGAVRLADAGEGRRGRGSDIARHERDGANAGWPEGVGVSEPRCFDGGLADTSDERLDGRRAGQASDGRYAARVEPQRLRDARGLGHADSAGFQAWDRLALGGEARPKQPTDSGALGQRLGDTSDEGLEGHGRPVSVDDAQGRQAAERHRPTSGFWSDPDWVLCRDEPVNKWRPVEPGTFPLAYGAPARVGRLRAYGNAIVSEVAATFIAAFTQSITTETP